MSRAFSWLAASLVLGGLAIALTLYATGKSESQGLGAALTVGATIVLTIAICAEQVDRPRVREMAKALEAAAVAVGLPSILITTGIDVPDEAIPWLVILPFLLGIALAGFGKNAPTDAEVAEAQRSASAQRGDNDRGTQAEQT